MGKGQTSAEQKQAPSSDALYREAVKCYIRVKDLFDSCNFSCNLLRSDSVPSPDAPEAFFRHLSKLARKCCSLYNQSNGLKRYRFGTKSEKNIRTGRKSEAKNKLSEQELIEQQVKQLTQEIAEQENYLAQLPRLMKAAQDAIDEHNHLIQIYYHDSHNLPAAIEALRNELAELISKREDVISKAPSDESATEKAPDDNDEDRAEDPGSAGPSEDSQEPADHEDSAYSADSMDSADFMDSMDSADGPDVAPKPDEISNTQDEQQDDDSDKIKERRGKEQSSKSGRPKNEQGDHKEDFSQSIRSNGMIIPDRRYIGLCPLLSNVYGLEAKSVADEVVGNIIMTEEKLNYLKLRFRDKETQVESTADPASCPALQITHDPINHKPDTQLDSPPVGDDDYDFKVPFVPNRYELADWAKDNAYLAAEYEAKLHLKYMFGFTPPLLNILCLDDGDAVYDPYLLKHTAAACIYRSVPLYSGTGLSVSCMMSLLICYGVGLMPLSRGMSTIEIYEELPLSASAIFAHYQKFCRAFLHRAANETAALMLDNSENLGMDESRIYLRAHALLPLVGPDGKAVTDKDGNIVLRGKKQSYIWITVPGPDEPYQGSIYHIFPGRDADNVVKILHRPERKVPLRYLMCDGYPGYNAGIDKLNEELGQEESVILVRCWQHAARRGENCLQNMNLKPLYSEICNCAIENKLTFDKAFERIRKLKSNGPGDSRFTSLNFIVMKIKSHIDDMHEFENILRHPRPDDKYQPHEIRKKQLDYAKEVMELCLQYVKKDRSVHYNEKTGKCSGAVQGSSGEFISYLLNQAEGLLNFAKSDHIPFTNTASERAIKDPAQHRRGFLFIDSLDSGMAYADLMTLVETCKKNKLNPHDYLLWLVCNIKLRVEQYRIKHKIPAQLLIQYQGLSKQEYDDLVKKSPELAVYGKLYQPCLEEQKTNIYDKISVKGLDVFSYKRLLERSSKLYSL